MRVVHNTIMTELPKTVDCIILGTSLTNSIIAAACSRVGKTVLHFDPNSYYGGESASFTFEQLVIWIKENYPDNEALQSIPKELIEKSRHFCIDLCPKLLFCNGQMVELLISSNVSRYHEFINKVRMLAFDDVDKLIQLPYKRSDIFTSPLLPKLSDKRKLTQFIEICLSYNDEDLSTIHKELEPHLDSPIDSFLEQRNISSVLSKLILNSVAMVEPSETTRSACKSIKKFMLATQRYGKSPFLFPIYGSGEFPQSFCRLSAVFGGTYCLNRSIDKVNDKGKDEEYRYNIEFDSGESIVNSKNAVIASTYANKFGLSDYQDEYQVSRAIIIAKSSILASQDKSYGVSYIRVASNAYMNDNPIHVLELDSTIAVTPVGYFVVYIWSQSCPNSIHSLASHLFSDEYEKNIVWRFFYDKKVIQITNQETSHIKVTNDCDTKLDYVTELNEAKMIFNNLYPDEEFLPRAPDPDELVV